MGARREVDHRAEGEEDRYIDRGSVPDWPGRDAFPGILLHSADYREPSPYRGRQVLVVGAGNSAAEIAVDLVGVGARVELSVRTPPNIVRRDTLGVPSQATHETYGP